LLTCTQVEPIADGKDSRPRGESKDPEGVGVWSIVDFARRPDERVQNGSIRIDSEPEDAIPAGAGSGVSPGPEIRTTDDVIPGEEGAIGEAPEEYMPHGRPRTGATDLASNLPRGSEIGKTRLPWIVHDEGVPRRPKDRGDSLKLARAAALPACLHEKAPFSREIPNRRWRVELGDGNSAVAKPKGCLNSAEGRVGVGPIASQVEAGPGGKPPGPVRLGSLAFRERHASSEACEYG
jgi:hypothetical protein